MSKPSTADTDLERMITNQAAKKKKGKKKLEEKPTEVKTTASTSSQHSAKKAHFVNLVDKDNVVILPGRHRCDCEARKHTLVNNCLSCGRIVCAQEASGPCFFCGKLVCTEAEEAVLSRGSKSSIELRSRLMMSAVSKQGQSFSLSDVGDGLLKAQKEKDKLLDFDRDSVRRTKVIDDQSDYFDIDNSPWLTPQQREQLRARKQELLAKKTASRVGQAQAVSIDFLGRRVFEETTAPVEMDDDAVLRAILEPNAANHSSAQETAVSRFPEGFGPMYVGTGEPTVSHPSDAPPDGRMGKQRALQDSHLNEMGEEKGVCLSMHQPWASLLVRGIKRDEGRSWYTAHRGRLWIASGAKPVERDQIETVEGTYRQFYGNAQLPAPFPIQYKTGCLVGCVDVIDCLPQEQYREQYPTGESESAYVLVCQNHHELPVNFPVRGQHKIYKLDEKVHQAARNMLDFRLK